MRVSQQKAMQTMLLGGMLLTMIVSLLSRGGEGLRLGLTLLWLLPPVLLLLRRRERAKSGVSGIPSTGDGSVPDVRFSDVAANEEALESLRDLVSFLSSPEKYSRFGARIPRGVLLYGAPGTGKTLLARALAGEAGVPFFAVNGADFVEMYVGVGASRVRALFQKARKAGKAVIFFDEIDAVGKKRDNRSDEREQTLNALLSEMSGFRESDGVVVLAATNRADTLDEALLRAGRFDRQIEVPLPTLRERQKILEVHARKKPLASDVSLASLAAETALFSGAKLESLLNEAAIRAAKRDAEQIARQDVDEALNQMFFGRERPLEGEWQAERELTAAHEAGHALLTALLLPESQLRRVSIIPTGKGAAGYSMAIPPEKLFHRRQELLHHMAVALAGREAEALYLGGYEEISNGASNDIEKAALLCQRMVCEWGMLPAGDEPYLFSQGQREAAQQQWLAMARQLAASLLRQREAAWRRLMEALLEKEALDGEEVRRCMEETA